MSYPPAKPSLFLSRKARIRNPKNPLPLPSSPEYSPLGEQFTPSPESPLHHVPGAGADGGGGGLSAPSEGDLQRRVGAPSAHHAAAPPRRSSLLPLPAPQKMPINGATDFCSSLPSPTPLQQQKGKVEDDREGG